MDPTGDDHVERTHEQAHEPRFRQGAEGPAGEGLRARADLLKALDVQFDGLVYRCCGRLFERFSDAVAHARHSTGQDRSRDRSVAHQRWRDSHLAGQLP